MKRIINKYLVTGFLVLATGYSLGPRVDLNETIQPLALPSNLATYISSSESRFADIKPNTEKTIVWANPEQHDVTHYSIVYLHGFSASRQEIAPVSDIVATTLGANLFYARFTGHGRDSKAMADVSVNALLNDTVEALEIGKRLGNKVIVIGTSTGATLATWLASYDKSDRIAALVLLSPNYGPKRKEAELLLLPWAASIVQLVEGPVYSFEPYNELQQQYWTTQYPSDALLAMMGIVKLTRDKDLRSIQSPVLLMYSPLDRIVDTEVVKETFAQFAAAPNKIIAVTDADDPQQHILAGDIMSPHTTEKVAGHIIEFIQQLAVTARSEPPK
jgi:pimeloyl-ACP methyl ester carboxylesterase